MKVIKTTVASLDTDSNLRSLIRALALVYYTYHIDYEEVTDEYVDNVLDSTIDCFKASAPLFKKDALGIPATELTAFLKQLAYWRSGKLDFDNASQLRRYENALTTLFLSIYEVLVETPVEELSTAGQKAVAGKLDDEERSLINSMLGYILGMGRRYNSSKMIQNTLKANAQIFSEDLDFYKEFRNELEDDGYTRPHDYKAKLELMESILKRNGIKTVDQDPYLPTALERERLKKINPEDHTLYISLKSYIVKQAVKAILGDLIFGSMGEPQAWNKMYHRVTREGSHSVYIPSDFFANQGWTGIVRAVKSSSERGYNLEHLSPFGESLKQNPVGNVSMNPSYVAGSTVFVATYIIPSSRALTTNYVYTLQTFQSKNQERFQLMRNILVDLPKYRAKWLKDLKAFGAILDKYYKGINSSDVNAKRKVSITPPNPTQWRKGILAMICEIGYQSAPRTGEKGNSSLMSDGSREATYALTTLRIGHVKIDPISMNPVNYVSDTDDNIDTSGNNKDITKITFAYKGKAGEPQQHIFTQATTDGDGTSRRILLKALTDYVSIVNHSISKDPANLTALQVKRLNFFRIPTSRSANVTDSSDWLNILNRHVNLYLKNDIKFPSTFKMFRKLKATKAFMDYMDSLGTSLTPETIEKHVLAGAAVAGQELGHAAAKSKASGSMALQHYIDAQTILGYYNAFNLEPSKKVANVIKHNLKDSKND